MPSRRFTLLVLGILAAAIGASYWNGFDIGFVFDDAYGVAENPVIRSLRNLPQFFGDPHAMWTDHTQVDLRPFLLFTYALNYAISGLDPWSYHALNLVLHFAAAVLVFFLVRDHVWWPPSERGAGGEGRYPAAAAALFFALAPLNSQPVNYIWARSALLCVTLYLAAFLLLLRGRWRAASGFFVLALLTKAIAVTLPVTYLAHQAIYRDRERFPTLRAWARDWRRLAAPTASLGLIVLGYLAYRQIVLPDWAAETRQATGITPWTWFVSQWSALLYYARLFLWPDGLSIDHDFPATTTLSSPRAWGALLVLVAWVALAFRARKRFPQVTFASFWFFVTLAPESSFAPLAEIINDHRPYIATSLGLSVLLSWALWQALSTVVPARRLPALGAVTCLLCVPAIAMNQYRTWQWKDSLRIWEDTARKSPRNPRAWVNAGRERMARGDLAGAREYLEKGREVGPGYAFAYMNLAVLATHEGRYEEALDAALRAVELRPDMSRTHYYEGFVKERMGRLEEAAAAYLRARDVNPSDADAIAGLARLEGGSQQDAAQAGLMKEGLDLLYERNDPVVAAQRFRRILQLNPDHYGATFQLATALDRSARPAEARPLWARVLEMADAVDDDDTAATARARLARADVPSEEALQGELMRAGLELLHSKNDPAAAAAKFEELLSRNPTHYGATFQLASALERAGDRKRALPYWERALAMAEASGDAETIALVRGHLD